MRKIKFLIFLIFTLCFLSFIFYFLFSKNPPISPLTPNQTPHPSTALRASPALTLIAVGDIMLGRSVNAKMRSLNDFTYPFQKTADILRSTDLTFGNLESPFWKDCPTTNTGMVFCADPKAIQGLTFSGFDILSIANNHILNYGSQGKQYTINLLQQNGILSSAENNIAIKQYNNLTIGFLSFDLTKTRSNQQILDMVTRYTSQAGILVISHHWGQEYEKIPQTWQTELAHQIIDSGAKVIIGHHPHVTQPTEEYNNGLIFYSLGNFVFDQPWSEETKKGKIAKIVFEGKQIKSWQEIPIYIIDYSQPKLINQ